MSKELDVEFVFIDSDSTLPRCIFTSRFLVKLKLVSCVIGQLSRVQMRSLKKLSLEYVKVEKEVLNKIICGCPSLQVLALADIYGLKELRFSVPNIEKLSITVESDLLLDCPNLKILNIIFYSKPRLQVVDVSSLCKVCIRSSEIIHEVDKLLKRFCNVEVIELDGKGFQVSFPVFTKPYTCCDVLFLVGKRFLYFSHVRDVVSIISM